MQLAAKTYVKKVAHFDSKNKNIQYTFDSHQPDYIRQKNRSNTIGGPGYHVYLDPVVPVPTRGGTGVYRDPRVRSLHDRPRPLMDEPPAS